MFRLLVVVVGLAAAFGEPSLRASSSAQLHKAFLDLKSFTSLFEQVPEGTGMTYFGRVGKCIRGDGNTSEKYSHLEMKPGNKFSVRHQKFSDPDCSEPKNKARSRTMVNRGCILRGYDSIKISAGPHAKTKELGPGLVKFIHRDDKTCEEGSWDYGIHTPLNVCFGREIVTQCLPGWYGMWSGAYMDYYDSEDCQGRRLYSQRYSNLGCYHIADDADDHNVYKAICSSGRRSI